MKEKPRYINAGGKLIDLDIPKVMGILNITSDSFYSGSRYYTDKEILGATEKMLLEGADILDVGGYSTRPGAPYVTLEEEKERVLRAIGLIAREFSRAVISIDTFRSDVAAEAVEKYGAHMVNDISGGEADGKMFEVIEKLQVPYILMHMKGEPATMQNNPVYDDLMADILRFLAERILKLRNAGVNDIIIDPGFGFGKTIGHNFELMRFLDDLSIAGLPVLVGVSRKSLIWKTLGITAEEALNGTTVLNTVALLKGADILRVHDVKEAVQAVRLISKLKT